MEGHQICLIFLICATVVSAAPTGSSRQDRQHLMYLNPIGNIKRITSALSAVNKPGVHSPSSKIAYFQDMPESELIDTTQDDDESWPKGFLGRLSAAINKRQGAWSYDYGLGGGRFGKRNYGDYGIGGGRYGRDVDHVDLFDANDEELAS